MRKALYKKSNLAILLILILSFSIAAVNTTLVAADRDGIGKWIYLGISPEGSGRVNITKLSNFDDFNSPYYEDAEVKVGAGDILLTAEGLEGYKFSYWLVDGVPTNAEIPEYTLKTTKGTTAIVAVFTRVYYIYPNVVGSGTITIDGMDVLDRISVEAGEDSPIFVFVPESEDYHISSIRIEELVPDGRILYLGYVTEYQFEEVDKDYRLTVSFSEDERAYVPQEPGALVHILDSSGNPTLSLEFIDPVVGGYAYGKDLFIPEGTNFVWNITTDFPFDDYVIIALKFGESFDPDRPENFNVSRASSADQLYSDVTGDNKIDVNDQKEVARAINDLGREYDPNYDINKDGVLNQKDIETVKLYIGTELTLIQYVGTAPNLSLDPLPQWYYPTEGGEFLYILTDAFSIFRGR